MRTLGWIVTIVALFGGGFYAHYLLFTPARDGAVAITHRTQPGGPTVEQVQKLASLVALRVPISDVQVSELEGLTGSVKLVLAVHGEVEIAADLSKAKFEDVNQEMRTALLVLPKPAPQRPRLDHEKTRILELYRGGAWKFLIGDAGEKVLTNNAMAAAQRVLADAAQKPELVDQACEQTETIVRTFFSTMQWTVTVQWDAAGVEEKAPISRSGH